MTSFVPGRLNKENVPSRAYIAFKNEGALATFSREYDGHVFRDKAGPAFLPLQLGCSHVHPIGITFTMVCAGNESQAIVEFAPFQKVPAEKRKPDARNNTIDKGMKWSSGVMLIFQ